MWMGSIERTPRPALAERVNPRKGPTSSVALGVTAMLAVDERWMGSRYAPKRCWEWQLASPGGLSGLGRETLFTAHSSSTSHAKRAARRPPRSVSHEVG